MSDQQRARFDASLANIYIQLRRLEFPSIGCLRLAPSPVAVSKMTRSIDINVQELEGLKPSSIQALYYKNGLLTSADAYVSMLLDIADNAFAGTRGSVTDANFGAEALYHLNIFRQYAEGWVDHRLDRGPFVLVHGDLEFFNLMVNSEMDVVSVLDWEWSRVVPLQFFKPPLWLRHAYAPNLAISAVYEHYLERFDQFLTVVRTLEREKYGNELLSDEWAEAKKDGGFLVANALENWTDIEWFAFRYINRKCYRGQDLQERTRVFMDDLARKSFIERKVREGIAYEAEVTRLRDKAPFPMLHLRNEQLDLEHPQAEDSMPSRLWRTTASSLGLVGSHLAQSSVTMILIIGTSYLLWKNSSRRP